MVYLQDIKIIFDPIWLKNNGNKLASLYNSRKGQKHIRNSEVIKLWA